MKTTSEKRKDLRRVRKQRTGRTKDRTPWRKKDLINAVLIENLPYGKFESPTGAHYYFNYEHELLLGLDPAEKRGIPVTRDGWFDHREWVRGDVTYLYDDPLELVEDTAQLVSVTLAYRDALLASGATEDTLVAWFESLSPAYVTKSTRFSVVSTLVQEFLPYGVCRTVDGVDVYHSKDYAVLFAWDNRNDRFAPTWRGMSLDDLALVGHSYVYGDSVPGDVAHDHPGTHPFDEGTFTLRKCMRILDTLGAQSAGI